MTQITRTHRMPQVNLLPPETFESRQTRKKVGLIALVGAALTALLMMFSVVQSGKITKLDTELQEIQGTNTQLNQTVTNLQRFQQLSDELDARLALVQSAVTGGVEWSHVMQDVAEQLPDGLWLTGMTATMGTSTTTVPAPPAPVPTTPAPTDTTAPPTTTTPTVPTVPVVPAAPSGAIVATMTFTGYAFEVDTVSQWLQNLQRVPGWANSWTSETTRAPQGDTLLYSFNATVDITSDYLAQFGSTS
jgi:Tfp pilus assembly protein PilN